MKTHLLFTTGLALIGLAGCGDDDDRQADAATIVNLVAYDSFVVPEGTFDAFTERTGLTVNVLNADDAGTMLSKAELTAGNPEGDVMWGIDNTLLARAIDNDVFQAYRPAERDRLSEASLALASKDLVTPVDEGDVCLNADVAWFADKGLSIPTGFDDLLAPAYRDLLVVENPATSSTGLAFMLATIDFAGEDGWIDYWTQLRANGVEVVDDWSIAYYERFSASTGRGPRPLVVSYGSSPPVEMLFADPRPAEAPTAVIEATCFHQIEFAGVLRGAANPQGAGLLIDYLISEEFQSLLPLNLFVYPARQDVALPQDFIDFTTRPTKPWTVSPGDIAEHSKRWIDEWTDAVLR